MEMTAELIETIKKLDERELLSYWIRGEYEEAETYLKLAERARELDLPVEVYETFEMLSRESRSHGDELYRIYRERYGDELAEVNVASIEGTHVLGKFWKVSDLEDVLMAAMESEKLAETIYRKLAEETDKEDLKSIYLRLADVERGHYERLKTLYQRRKID